MLLTQLLAELEAARGPVNINELSQKLGIERSALAGMIDFWVRKGRLRHNDPVAAEAAEMCASGSCSCSCSCPGPTDCPYVVKLPLTYSLVVRER